MIKKITCPSRQTTPSALDRNSTPLCAVYLRMLELAVHPCSVEHAVGPSGLRTHVTGGKRVKYLNIDPTQFVQHPFALDR